MVQAVVEAHDTHNHFYPDWEIVKDRPTEPTYPCVFWKQYTGRMAKDDIGWYRTQLVQLWVITSVATDRTPVQLQQAVEAADAAARDFVMTISALVGDGGAFDGDPEISNPDNVVITTMHDEYAQLLSGVILNMTIRGARECEDTDPPPPSDCPTLCELLGADTDPLTTAGCVTDQNAPAMGSILMQRSTYTADLIVEHIGNAGKTAGVQALICDTCDPVEIIDQNSSVIDTVAAGGQYQVFVLDEINDEEPYETAITINDI